jgi:hypothetical protein
MGIVYLLQPEELVGTNRYKVGHSKKDTIDRAKGYKKNSKIIYYVTCKHSLQTETKIKNAFKQV